MSEEHNLIVIGSHSTFISYARSDGRALARTLRQELESRGFNVWQDVGNKF